MHITEKKVSTPAGELTIYRIENVKGAWVELSTLGAGVVGLGVPDRDGNIENVTLAYSDSADYMSDGPGMGKCPGRYANRIGYGKFSIEGRGYSLDTNLPPHHLHGGATGFHNRVWQSCPLEDGVEFRYASADGEEGYPGALEVTAVYRWSDDCRLTLEFSAKSDADTVVNLTNHCYWNLRGADCGSVLSHEMKIKASYYVETDDKLLPTGRIAPVTGNPMDFSDFKEIGRDIESDFDALRYGKGYDHCYVIDGWEPGLMSEGAVVIRDRKSGRILTVDSDQPGVQIYTGNWLKGSARNRSGRFYEDYDGVAVEMQGFPDAPNRPEFPSQILRKGGEYRRRIIYAFSCE